MWGSSRENSSASGPENILRRSIFWLIASTIDRLLMYFTTMLDCRPICEAEAMPWKIEVASLRWASAERTPNWISVAYWLEAMKP